MDGREAGDSFQATVPAAEAYGERREGLSQRIPKKHFGAQKLEPACRSCCRPTSGARVTIEKVGMSVVDVDLNHPMAAGPRLRHRDRRSARRSEEELAHGHARRGGHHH